jgi:3-hydroxybutyryl-CoA dehydrogenase
MQIERISVIGAGTMGAGIAQVFAAKGHAVKLIDVSAEFVKRGLSTIESSLDRMVKKETIPLTTKTEIMGRIRTDTTLEATGASQLVVEVSENVDSRKIWRKSRRTSTATRFSPPTPPRYRSRVGRDGAVAESFIGMHFMNPVR